jgi:hypothetical protein
VGVRTALLPPSQPSPAKGGRLGWTSAFQPIKGGSGRDTQRAGNYTKVRPIGLPHQGEGVWVCSHGHLALTLAPPPTRGRGDFLIILEGQAMD